MNNLIENLNLLYNKDFSVALKNVGANTITFKNDINQIVEELRKNLDRDILYPIFSYDKSKYFCIKLTPEHDKALDIQYTLKIKLTRSNETFVYCFFRHDNIYDELAERLSSLKSFGAKITEDTILEIIDAKKCRKLELDNTLYSFIKKSTYKRQPKKDLEYWEYIKENDKDTYAISRYLLKNLFPIPLKDEDYNNLSERQIELVEENDINYTGLYLNLAELRILEGLLRLVYCSEYRFSPPQYKFFISKRTFHSLVKDFRAEETLKGLEGKLYLYRGDNFIVAPIIEVVATKDKFYIITLNQYFLKDLNVNKTIDTGDGFEIRSAGFYHHKLNSDIAFTKLLNYICWASVQHPKKHSILCSMKTLLKSIEIYDLIKKQSKPFVLKKLNKYFDCLFNLGYIGTNVQYSNEEFNEFLKNGKALNINIDKTTIFTSLNNRQE